MHNIRGQRAAGDFGWLVSASRTLLEGNGSAVALLGSARCYAYYLADSLAHLRIVK